MYSQFLRDHSCFVHVKNTTDIGKRVFVQMCLWDQLPLLNFPLPQLYVWDVFE